MARELGVFLMTASFTGTFQPLTICKGIKHMKKMLEFIGEIPEWKNFNENLEEDLQNLRRKRDCLENVQTDIETELDTTERQSGKKRKREVDHWMTSVKRKAVEVRDVEDNVNSVSYIPRFLFRAWLGSSIKKEIDQLNELLDQGKFPQGLLLDGPQDGGEPLVTTSLVGQAVAEKLVQIWSHLINPITTKIGVRGPQGSGKSAIMAHVYNRLSQYYRVYYVNVPQNFTIFSLQTALAAEMKVNLPSQEGSEAWRAARISKVLDSIKECVLILDGVSQHFCLEEVGICMERNAQKLVLTSQSQDVCRRMSCQETVVLESLHIEDSETLFMEKLQAPAPSLSEEIRDVARQIVSRCEGIPSRIITMAVQLRGVSDINEWQTTLNEM